MKGTATVHATLLRLLKRFNVPLKRDVILLAVADEEAGGSGALSVIKDHPELISGAEFLINEGDVPYVKNGKLEQYGVDVMEKAALWLRITAKGPAGHGSIPLSNSSVERLLSALERLRRWETPIRVLPAVAEGYRMRASQQSDPVLKNAYLDLEKSLADPSLRQKLLADSTLNAEVRNTFSITGLKGSEKVNVIPGEASAQIDARILPGETPDGFITKLREVLKDPDLQIEVLEGSVRLDIERKAGDELILDTRDLTVESVTDLASDRMGVHVRPIFLSQPEAGFDVDTSAQLAVADAFLRARELRPGPPRR